MTDVYKVTQTNLNKTFPLTQKLNKKDFANRPPYLGAYIIWIFAALQGLEVNMIPLDGLNNV